MPQNTSFEYGVSNNNVSNMVLPTSPQQQPGGTGAPRWYTDDHRPITHQNHPETFGGFEPEYPANQGMQSGAFGAGSTHPTQDPIFWEASPSGSALGPQTSVPMAGSTRSSIQHMNHVSPAPFIQPSPYNPGSIHMSARDSNQGPPAPFYQASPSGPALGSQPRPLQMTQNPSAQTNRASQYNPAFPAAQSSTAGSIYQGGNLHGYVHPAADGYGRGPLTTQQTTFNVGAPQNSQTRGGINQSDSPDNLEPDDLETH